MLFGIGIVATVCWFLFLVAVGDFFFQDATLRFLARLAMIVTPMVFCVCIFLLLAVAGRLAVAVPLPWFIAEGPNREFRFECFILLVSSTIVLGMNLVLCIKTIRILNAVTAAGF